jgi:N-acetylneuraminic acid mutarotase
VFDPNVSQGPGAPQLVIEPKQLDFGVVGMGEVSAPQHVVLRNPDPNLPLTIAIAPTTGTGDGSFVAALPELPFTLGPGRSLSVPVTFEPAEKGYLTMAQHLGSGARGERPETFRVSGLAMGAPGDEVAVNSGGAKFSGSEEWSADWTELFGAEEGIEISTADPITGAGADEAMFQTAREGRFFTYTFPLDPGEYLLELNFAEISATGPNQRRMNLVAEGSTVLSNWDLWAQAGHDTAYTLAGRLPVTDGSLDLVFGGVIGDAIINGLRVRAIPTVTAQPIELDFGPVAGGTTDQLDLVLENLGPGDATITWAQIDEASVGSSSDFEVDFGAGFVSGGTGAVVTSPMTVIPDGGQLVVPVRFTPTDENFHSFDLNLNGILTVLTIPVSGLGGHAGHPFLHPVPRAPAYVVDYDGGGDEVVSLDGVDSHTHEPGKVLTSWQWHEGATLLGLGGNFDATLTLGDHVITHTIGDDNVPQETYSADVNVSVVTIDQIPGVRALYYDTGGSPPVPLIDALPATADFAEILDELKVVDDGGAGGSSLSLNFIVSLSARIDVQTAGSYTFDALGGAASKITVGAASGYGQLVETLATGYHDVEVRFAVNSLAELPLELLWTRDTEPQEPIRAGLLVHDDTGVLPVINDLPTEGSSLGGNEITIEGYGFFPSDQVTVHWGGTDLTELDFTEVGPSTIRFDSPPGLGPIQVTVETPQGISNARTFTYSAQGPLPVRFNFASFASASRPTCGEWGPDGRLWLGSFSGVLTAIEYDEDYNVVSETEYDGVSAFSAADDTVLGIGFNPWDPPGTTRVYVAHGELFAQGGSSFTGPSPYPGYISIVEGPNFDTWTTIVTNLPVSNHDHSLNGMQFDNNGDLLLTVGSQTNAGVAWPPAGDLPESPLSSAILKIELSNPSFNGTINYLETVGGLVNNDQVFGEDVDVEPGVHVTVHAPGLRNPYDLVFTTKSRLYATDNGPNTGFGPASTGPATTAPDPYFPDEINFVEYGNYYGHPNRNRGRYDARQNVYHDPYGPSIPGVFTQAMVDVPSSTNGIIEYRSDAFGGEMRGDLLAMKWGSKPRRVELSEDGRSIDVIAQITDYVGALDIVMGPGGTLLGVDYSNDRIRALVPDDPSAVGLVVQDICPWRAPAAGGTEFEIAGVGFGTLLDTTVTIGGLPATLTSVTSKRIIGTVPVNGSPTTDLVDVVVTVGPASDTHEAAFRYLFAPGNEPGRWETYDNATAILGEVSCGVIDGVVYMVGEGSGKTLAYDVAAKYWDNNLAQRTYKGHHHAAEVWGGKLYLFGGLGGGSEGRVQIYDPVLDSWSDGATMPWSAGSVNSALIDDIVYVFGGIVGSSTVDTGYSYDPALDTWSVSALAPMPQGRNHAAPTTDGEKLYVFGGRTGGNWVANGFDEVQISDPVLDTWESSADVGSSLAPLPQARGGTGKAVWYQGEFYVFGGETQNGAGATPMGVYDRVDVYDPVANTWRLEAPMPTARHGIFPVLYESRIFVAAGGVQAANSQSVIFEVFTRQ